MNLLASQRLLYHSASLLYKIARHRRRNQSPLSPRRVVHISPTYFSEASLIGGGERYATDLAQATAQHLDATLVTFGQKRQSLRQHQLKIEIYPAITWLNGVQYDPLCYTFLKEIAKADIIHCHQYRLAVTNLALLAGAALGKRIFVTDTGGVGWHITDRFPVSDLVDGFLPISRFSARLLPAERQPAILYGGVPEQLLADPVRQAPGLYALFVGRLLPHKGINYLVEAIDGPLCLKIVGRPYHQDYFTLLQHLAAGKHINFITNASDEDLRQAYRQAIVTILPSVYDDVYGHHHPMPELLGLVLLESMASGVPVICTDVGSMPEIVDDGVTGFVVPANNPIALRDRITYLWQNPEIARQMGQAARQKVLAEFTWEAVAQRCLSAYSGEQG